MCVTVYVCCLGEPCSERKKKENFKGKKRKQASNKQKSKIGKKREREKKKEEKEDIEDGHAAHVML